MALQIRRVAALLTVTTTVLGIGAAVPTAAEAAPPPGCVVPETLSSAAKAGGWRDGDELTDAQVQQHEEETATALAAKAARRAKTNPNLLAAQAAIPPMFWKLKFYVHVIMKNNTRAGGNIPDSMVYALTPVLNRSLAGLTGGANTNFRFDMPIIDRVTKPEWWELQAGTQAERDMKRALYKGDKKTLNLYVTQLTGNKLGWAPMPSADIDFMDGIVVRTETLPGGNVGEFGQGDTSVHELGHWLGLYHTFQGGCTGGDQVSDTAPEASNASGCPTGRNTCSGGGVDPISNFMDYTSDACRFQFTAGQAERMFSQFRAFRE